MSDVVVAKRGGLELAFATRSWSLTHKIVAGMLASGLLAAAAVGLGSYMLAANVVEHDIQERLLASQVGRGHGLDSYIKTVEADLDFLASAGMSRGGLSRFQAVYGELSPAALQKAYIDDNPHPLGEKHKLDAAGASNYDAAHKDIHPSFRQFLESRGYYDIFLITTDGEIVYSVFKERDYATNLLTGPYQDSGLGAAFRSALKGDRRSFTDFAPYAPSNGAPAAFVAAAVTDLSGAVAGVVALQIPSDRIADAIALGDGAKSFIIGPEGALRTDLAATPEYDILSRKVSGDWFNAMVGGAETAFATGRGVLGEPSVISAKRKDVLGKDWFIVSETPLAVANAPLVELRNAILLVALPLGLIVGALAFWFGRGLAGSIRQLSAAMIGVSEGRLDTQIPHRERQDEVGEMASALETFRRNLSVQIAVSAAVDSNSTPMLLLDRDGGKIAGNKAFEALWAQIGERMADYSKRRDDGWNFAALIRKLDELAKDPANRVIKSDGDFAMALRDGPLILEVKRSAVVDRFGQTIGDVLELMDVSTVRKLEEELLEVIARVERGEFVRSVYKIDSLGFTSVAAGGVNSLLDAIAAFIERLDEALEAMARGDLTRPIRAEFKGDLDTICERYNLSLEAVRKTVEQATHTAQRVGREAEPIAAGGADLAARAESQASTLQQTAATMEEMSANIRSNADNAKQAAEMSRRACEMAAAGGEVVEETVGAMGRIEESSSRISDIISVIESIAFQTNLLALNAAVEAARAGEAGKGFAVVASEVRTLAQRSSEAAKDIKQLIETSSSHVADGSALVSRTGESLRGLVGEMRSVAEVIATISEAVREQSVGVAEITASVNQLDVMTQENATLAERSAQSAASLRSSSQDLDRLMAAFETGGGAAATQTAAVAFAAE